MTSQYKYRYMDYWSVTSFYYESRDGIPKKRRKKRMFSMLNNQGFSYLERIQR